MMRPPTLLCLMLSLHAGCASAVNRQPALVTHQSQAVVGPHIYTCYWTPGEYTNFVVVSATDLHTPLLQWPTWLETMETNFPFTVDDPQRFFALYGTNKVTRESAWGGN